MKTDAQLKDDVTEELRWDPQISDADVIGAAVRDGAVILSGQAPRYAEKMAAAQAAAASAPGVSSVESHLVIARQMPAGDNAVTREGKEPR